MKAAGLNRSDVYSRTTTSYGKDGPEIPGLEVSGTIAQVGPASNGPGPAETPANKTTSHRSRWQPGDEVCALVTGGGYAEYVAVPGGQCLPIPAGWSLEAAATLPGDRLYRLGQRFPHWRAKTRRTFPRTWRQRRYRHYRYPTSVQLESSSGLYDGGHRREMPLVRVPLARPAPSIIKRKISK